MSKCARGYKSGTDRSQVQLFPPCLDDYVEENSPVRFIDVFVEGLDMSSLQFTHHNPAETGRPSYDPKILLRLFIYGYLRRVESSRRLEAESQRNVEVMWLLNKLQPDHKTISRFRRENADKFVLVLRAFNRACRELELFSREVAVDGSKFKASNSADCYLKRETEEAAEKHAATKVATYLEALARADAADDQELSDSTLSKEELQSKIAYWQKKQAQAASAQQLLDQHGLDEMGQTDPDSRRLMDRKHRRGVVGYNAQLAVDTKSHLIVAVDAVSDKNDLNQLGPMSLLAQSELGIDAKDEENLTVLADAGYHEANQLEQCEDNKITAIVPSPPTTSGRTKEGIEIFPKEAFCYGANDDSYQCPSGAVLLRTGKSTYDDVVKLYYSNPSACSGCVLKAQCSTAPYRRITRRENEAVVERAAVCFASNKERFAKRKSTVEHVFGTLRNRGQDKFLQRGKSKVLGELNLSALAYNITRAINLVGLSALIEAVMV
jgi:transposase